MRWTKSAILLTPFRMLCDSPLLHLSFLTKLLRRSCLTYCGTEGIVES